MALNASTSAASSSSSQMASPHQAGPLSPKRGEFGFREDVHGQAADEESTRSMAGATDLPARHPADRDHDPQPSRQSAAASEIPPLPIRPSTPTSAVDTPTNASDKPSRISTFFNPKALPSFGGIRLITLLLLTAQTCILGATLAAWILSAKRLNDSGFRSPEIGVTIHVMFSVALLGQLILLGRRIHQLRAERWAYLHPGEILPTSRRLSSPSASTTNLAPWNQPPLPTYTASLAASGHGTGDVEDHIIAVPPPPAYGNTRGSKLILSGFLSESLRAQRPPSSSSQMSRKSERPPSQDGQLECDRVTRLEETMVRLEEGRRRSDDAEPSSSL